MDHRKSIAVFLIVLILGIPVYTSSVLAGSSASISISKISGKDGIGNSTLGVRRFKDNLTVLADVSIEGDPEIVPEQVKLRVDSSSSEYNFLNCTKLSSSFRCVFKQENWLSGMHTYNFYLYNDAGVYLLGSTARTITDKMPPKIDYFDVDPGFSRLGKFNLSFGASDLADEGLSGCAGIKKIEIYDKDPEPNSSSLIKSFSFSDGMQCVVNGTYEFSADKEKEYNLCIRAFDFFGQNSSGERCVAFKFNSTDPHLQDKLIKIRSIRLTDASGKDITELKSTETDAYIEVYVTGENISIGNALNVSVNVSGSNESQPLGTYADLSSFSMNDPSYKHMLPVSSVPGPNSTTFKWKVKISSLYKNFDGNAKIYVKDTLGRTYPAEKAFTLNYTGPKPSPKVGNIDIKVIHGSELPVIADDGINLTYIAKGDLLLINVNVTDDPLVTSISAYADISGIVSSYASNFTYDIASFEGLCGVPNATVSERSFFTCTWETPEITVEGPKKAELKFTFVNDLGGIATASKVIDIAALLGNGTDFWDSEIDCYPSEIDRQIAPLTTYRIYCNVKLIPKVEGLTVLSSMLEGCGDDAPASVLANSSNSSSISSEAIVGEKLMNNFFGNEDLYLQFKLRNSDYKDVDSIDETCRIVITSKRDSESGMYITSAPETEELGVNLNLYNLPLGDLGKNVKNKIKDIKDDTFVSMEYIGSLYDILHIMKQVCKMIRIAVQIYQLYGFVTTLMSSNPGTKTLGLDRKWQAATEALGSKTDTFLDDLGSYCQWISCDKALWGGWYTNFQKSVENSFSPSGPMDKLRNKYGFQGLSVWPKNPSDSIILSIATGCIPGILDNIQKWRQIQCNYGLCLVESSKNQIPIKVCDDQRAFLECKFIFGEIFQLIPFADFVKNMLSQLTHAISDPVRIIFGVTGFLCRFAAADSSTYGFCVVTKAVGTATQVIMQIYYAAQNFDNFFKPKNDVCKKFLEDEYVKKL